MSASQGKTHKGTVEMLNEFKAFIARGNVLDLAVGVVIGAAFTAIVTSLVDDLINPLIGLWAYRLWYWYLRPRAPLPA